MYFDYICLPLLSSHFCWPLSSSKTGLFSLSCIFFLVCMCNCVCGNTGGYKCSCARNACGSQMTILGVGPQTLSTFALGWGLSVARNFTTWTRPADRRFWEFSSLQLHLTVLCLQACVAVCMLVRWLSKICTQVLRLVRQEFYCLFCLQCFLSH